MKDINSALRSHRKPAKTQLYQLIVVVNFNRVIYYLRLIKNRFIVNIPNTHTVHIWGGVAKACQCINYPCCLQCLVDSGQCFIPLTWKLQAKSLPSGGNRTLLSYWLTQSNFKHKRQNILSFKYFLSDRNQLKVSLLKTCMFQQNILAAFTKRDHRTGKRCNVKLYSGGRNAPTWESVYNFVASDWLSW